MSQSPLGGCMLGALPCPYLKEELALLDCGLGQETMGFMGKLPGVSPQVSVSLSAA